MSERYRPRTVFDVDYSYWPGDPVVSIFDKKKPSRRKLKRRIRKLKKRITTLERENAELRQRVES